jgi:hypothetical protein
MHALENTVQTILCLSMRMLAALASRQTAYLSRTRARQPCNGVSLPAIALDLQAMGLRAHAYETILVSPMYKALRAQVLRWMNSYTKQ